MLKQECGYPVYHVRYMAAVSAVTALNFWVNFQLERSVRKGDSEHRYQRLESFLGFEYA